jgi:hypothetical protein
MQNFNKSTQLQLYFTHKKDDVELVPAQKGAFSLALVNLFTKWNLLFHLTNLILTTKNSPTTHKRHWVVTQPRWPQLPVGSCYARKRALEIKRRTALCKQACRDCPSLYFYIAYCVRDHSHSTMGELFPIINAVF